MEDLLLSVAELKNGNYSAITKDLFKNIDFTLRQCSPEVYRSVGLDARVRISNILQIMDKQNYPLEREILDIVREKIERTCGL